MHDSVVAWIAEKVGRLGLRERSCLDVGSYNVNGSVRSLFSGEYVGVDMRMGPGVDRVVNAHDLVSVFGPARFGVVVCCEVLEHDPAFWISMRNMGEVLVPGGWLLLTTRGIGFHLHEYPNDLWRFTEDAGIVLGKLAGLSSVVVESDPQASGIFLAGHRSAKIEDGDR